MAHEPHVPSYYAATAAAPPERPALAGDLRADVCVVGAGFTGLSAALNLAERGYRVAVLEANRVGWGASGRNGGQIGSGFAADMAWLEGWAGRAAARGLFTLAEEAKAIIRERVERHGISCDLKWGTFHAASKARHMPGLAAKQAHWSEAYGYQGLRLAETPDEAHRYVNSPSYIGGIFDPGSGHLHPLKYCQGLARAAEEAGATIFEGSPVIGLETGTGGAGQVAAKTGCGCVKADFLLLCGNAYLGDLVPEIRRVIAPLSSYIVATHPLGQDKAADVIPADCAVFDNNHILSYYRLSADRRMRPRRDFAVRRAGPAARAGCAHGQAVSPDCRCGHRIRLGRLRGDDLGAGAPCRAAGWPSLFRARLFRRRCGDDRAGGARAGRGGGRTGRALRSLRASTAPWVSRWPAIATAGVGARPAVVSAVRSDAVTGRFVQSPLPRPNSS